MGFIGENLGKVKGLRYLLFFNFLTYFFLSWGFNGYKEQIIQLD